MSILYDILESIKNPFLKQPIEKIDGSIPLNKVIQNLSDDSPLRYQTFFDSLGATSYANPLSRASEQAQKINIYRQTAKIAEVWDAIGEIVDEVIYSRDIKEPLKIEVTLKNKKLEDLIKESFEKILRLLNVRKYLHQFVRTTFIDGQMNVLLKYDEKKGGIEQIYLLDPRYLWFDFKDQKYKYQDISTNSSHPGALFGNLNPIKFQTTKNIRGYDELHFSFEEIVHQNFGIFSETGVCLSEIEPAIKPANQLRTLEDLLIPLRFSRSVSRRVFNVDVSELPNSKAEAYMNKLVDKFKYNKHYNTDTGEVTNNQHLTTMIEDYWVGNKSGAKGLQVDVLDETGNLGELGDIQYFQKLLYRAMGVPTNRTPLSDESQSPLFDTNSDSTTNEDMRFFQKVTRIRQVYTEFFTQLLKRDLISKKVFKEEDFDEEIKQNINIYFSEENQFIERMNVNLFLRKIESFGSARDFAGTVLPTRMLYKEIFKFTDAEIDEILKEMQKEARDPLLRMFYKDLEYDLDSDTRDDDSDAPDDEPDNPDTDSDSSSDEPENSKSETLNSSYYYRNY